MLLFIFSSCPVSHHHGRTLFSSYYSCILGVIYYFYVVKFIFCWLLFATFCATEFQIGKSVVIFINLLYFVGPPVYDGYERISWIYIHLCQFTGSMMPPIWWAKQGNGGLWMMMDVSYIQLMLGLHVLGTSIMAPTIAKLNHSCKR